MIIWKGKGILVLPIAALVWALGVLLMDGSSKDWEHNEAFAEALVEVAGPQASLFAAGILSDGMYQRDTAISSDYDHFLYSLQQGRTSRMMHMHRQEGGWSEPEAVPFSGSWRNLEPAFKPGTMDLFFASDRPLPDEEEAGDFNLWRTRWEGDDWTEPTPLPEVNGAGNEFYPSLTADGFLFFTSAREGGVGGEDLWMAAPDGSGFHPPQALGAGVNTAGDEFNAAVDASGTLLCFGSVRDDGPGGGDLFLSRREGEGPWQTATLLGADVNTEQLDFCPFFDPDMDVLWFTSTRPSNVESSLNLSDLKEAWGGPGNGSGDLYRIDLETLLGTWPSPFEASSGEQDPAVELKAQTYPPVAGVLETAEAYLAVYLARDYPAMLPLMAQDAVFTDPTSTMFGTPLHHEGAQAIVDWLTEVGTGVESVEFLIDRSFVSGEYAVFEGTYRTSGSLVGLGYPDLHTTLVHRGITTIRVVDGKVALHLDVIDYEEMWHQIDDAVRALEREE